MQGQEMSRKQRAVCEPSSESGACLQVVVFVVLMSNVQDTYFGNCLFPHFCNEPVHCPLKEQREHLLAISCFIHCDDCNVIPHCLYRNQGGKIDFYVSRKYS